MYKPKRKETEFKPSPSGTGIVKLLEKPRIGVKFDEDNKNNFAGKKYVVEAYPDYVKNPKILEKYRWYIKLNSDANEIYSVNPINGEFVGHCIGLARQEGKPPVPRQKRNDFGVYHDFIALIEITEGDCAGMVVPYTLRYNFGEDDEGTGEVVYTNWGSDQATHSPRLHEFLITAGAWEFGAIKFSDNILPELHERIINKDKTFKFLMKDGWIDRVWNPESDRVDQFRDVEAEGLWKEDGWDESESVPVPQDDVASDPPWDTDETEETKDSDDFNWD